MKPLRFDSVLQTFCSFATCQPLKTPLWSAGQWKCIPTTPELWLPNGSAGDPEAMGRSLQLIWRWSVCKGLLILHSTGDLGAIRQTMRQRHWEPPGTSCSLGWQHLCHEQSPVQDRAMDMRSLCLSSYPLIHPAGLSFALWWPWLLLCHENKAGTG